MNTEERARVLVEALPYIQKYNGKRVVIKYGGNAMVNEALKEAVMRDVVLLSLVGIKVVLVHGGGPEISEMLKKIGKESRFVNGLRYTDAETADVVQMVLSGKVNKGLVGALNRMGAKAIGISGVDGSLLETEPLDPELGFVGKVRAVDPGVIEDALGLGYVPVVSTIGTDRQGNVYNVNADTAAAAIAGSLKAESLILMTDVKGLMRDKQDESTLIEEVNVSDVPQLIAEGIISGGMIPKVDCCCKAIRQGVNKVFILDGRVPHSILIEVLSDLGSGTMFVKGD